VSSEKLSHLGLERRLESRIRLVACLSLGLIVILPFLHRVPFLGLRTFSWSYLKLFTLQTAALIAVAGLMLIRPARLDEMIAASSMALPMALLLAWGALSIAWSNHRWAAIEPLVQLAYMAIAVIAFSNLLTSNKIRLRFTAAYGIAAGTACLIYTLADLTATSHMRVYPFENPNVAAAFAIIPMTAGAAFAISAAARRIPARAGLLGGAIALACAAAILTSQSAAAAAAAGGAFILALALSFRNHARRILFELIALLALLILLWPLLGPGTWPQTWLIEQLGPRPAIWQGALSLAREHPLWGQGLGTFAIEFTRVYPKDFALLWRGAAIAETAHCLPLHIFVELGLVGLALTAWLIARALKAVRRANLRASHYDRALLRGIFCGGLGMLAQGLVSTTLHSHECTINLVLGLAVIGGTASIWWRRSVPGEKTSALGRTLPVLLLCGIFLLTAWRGLDSQRAMHRAWSLPRRKTAACRAELQHALTAVWPTFYTLKARIKLSYTCRRDGRLNQALTHTRISDLLAPNFCRIKRHEADLYLALAIREVDQPRKLAYLGNAADALLAYCEKDPFDRLAYGVWAEVLHHAQQANQPHIARPHQAVRLLTIAEQHSTLRLLLRRARIFNDLKKPFQAAAAR